MLTIPRLLVVSSVLAWSATIAVVAQAPQAERPEEKPVTLAVALSADDAQQVCDPSGGCVTAKDVRTLIAERTKGQRTLADSVLEQLADAQDQLTQARMERANCETTLGPLELKARQQDARDRAAQIKGLIEQQHPGYDYDPRTRRLTLKPPVDPPAAAAPEKK